MTGIVGEVQSPCTQGVVDLGPGAPDPSLVPRAAIAAACAAECALDAGFQYGPNVGSESLAAAIRRRLPPALREQGIFVTSGTIGTGIAAAL